MGTLAHRLALACDLTVFTCIDYRLHKGDLRPFLEGFYGRGIEFDLSTKPGSCYPLVRGTPEQREQVIADLATSVSFHQPETIALIQHTECGGYHSNMCLEPNTHEERDILLTDLADAEPILREHFPQLRVESYIARLHEGRIVELERVAPMTRLTRERASPLEIGV